MEPWNWFKNGFFVVGILDEHAQVGGDHENVFIFLVSCLVLKIWAYEVKKTLFALFAGSTVSPTLMREPVDQPKIDYQYTAKMAVLNQPATGLLERVDAQSACWNNISRAADVLFLPVS